MTPSTVRPPTMGARDCVGQQPYPAPRYHWQATRRA